jgi:hypothetical protein
MNPRPLAVAIILALTIISPLFFTSPTAEAAAPEPPRINAVVDKTISTNLWLTTGVSAGTGSGNSFANRVNITSWEPDIGSITVNADANLTIVLETWNGWITLGDNQVAGKTFTCNGGFYTVDSTNAFSKTSSIRCAIGGTTSYKDGGSSISGFTLSRFFNLDFGQDSSGNAVSNQGAIASVHRGVYAYGCTYKCFSANPYYLGGYYESCTFNGASSGTATCFNPLSTTGLGNSIILNSCTQITTFTSWLTIATNNAARIGVVGALTKGGAGGGTITVGSGGAIVQFYRRAYLKTTTDGSTALSGVYYSATEATGGVDMPLASGITGADGLCTPESPTPYNDAIFCLQKVENYIKTSAGAMTWGAPSYTTTYGNYQFAFSAFGYDLATYNRTMTTDWGTASSPIAITMNATTGGSSGPAVSAAYPSPSNGTTSVPLTENYVISFSAGMQTNAGNVTVWPTPPTAGTWSWSANTRCLNNTAIVYTPGVQYFVNLTDAKDNTSASIGFYSWSFTAATADLANLAIYSYTTATGSVRTTEYFQGDTIYADGTLTSDIAATAWVNVSLYRVGAPDVFINTFVSKSYAYAAASLSNALTTINTTRPAYHTTTATQTGNYYWIFTSNGTQMATTTVRSYFFLSYQWPSITDLYISDVSITQDESLIIGGNLTGTDLAVAILYGATGLPVVSASSVVNLSGFFNITFNGSHIPVGVYNAGSVIVYAVNASTSGYLASDASLAVTVTPGAATPTTTTTTHHTTYPPSNRTSIWSLSMEPADWGKLMYLLTGLGVIAIIAIIALYVNRKGRGK